MCERVGKGIEVNGRRKSSKVLEIVVGTKAFEVSVYKSMGKL